MSATTITGGPMTPALLGTVFTTNPPTAIPANSESPTSPVVIADTPPPNTMPAPAIAGATVQEELDDETRGLHETLDAEYTSAPATTAITNTTRRQWSIVHPAHALLTELENFVRDVGFDAHEMIEKIRETL